MYGQNVINLPDVCVVVAATCIKNARKYQMKDQHRLAATASWWAERNPTRPTIGAAATRRKRPEDETLREHLRTQPEGCSPSNYTTPGQSFAATLQNKVEQQQQPQIHRVPAGRSCRSRKEERPISCATAKCRSVIPAPDASSLPLDNMFIVVPVVQQIMTEFNGAASKEDKIVAITKIVLDLMEQNGH
jgi:hypothetical protein